jgi:tetratricopeptide (TPR) repeat protein
LQGHFADAEPYLVQAARLTDETPGPWQWSWSVSLRAISLAMRGQVGAGLGEIQRGLARMDAMANPVGMVQCRAYVLPIYVELGDMAQLLATSRQTAELASSSGHPLFVAIGLGYEALALSRLGQHEGARLRLAESEAAAARVGGQFLMCDWLAAFHAEIAFNAGALEDALTGAAAAAAFARSRDGLFAEAWSQRVWGQALAALAPHEWREAENHMRESARLFAESDAAPELARTHVAWGLLCRARESVASAREHLEHALRIFERTDIDAESAEVSALVKLI